MFKRKVYDYLKAWKEESDGMSAVMVEGARRVGKSTVVEEFAKEEYRFIKQTCIQCLSFLFNLIFPVMRSTINLKTVVRGITPLLNGKVSI